MALLIFGINENAHNASLSVVRDGEILFSAEAERFTKIKNDPHMSRDLILHAIDLFGGPDSVAYYEDRRLKKKRLKKYGGREYGHAGAYKNIHKSLTFAKEVSYGHHESHAAAGFLTSPFSTATVVVVDAIGEFDTASIWLGNGAKIKKLLSIKYPVSFGLFYSWFTSACGLEAGKDEYILMGMAAYGDPCRFYKDVDALFPSVYEQARNFHMSGTISDIGIDVANQSDLFDVAAAVQVVFEARIIELVKLSIGITKCNNLVLMGGCALNCVANYKIRQLVDQLWILPNPGDGGSSLGAAALLSGQRVNWRGPYLGVQIHGEYPIQEALSSIASDGAVAIANGRAEFGPRALGNRSILADPRMDKQKLEINKLKKREQFRPFAPVVPAEYANNWFDIDYESPYMQMTVPCKRPDLIPAVVHVDGTSRVQTVRKDQHPGLHSLLLAWGEMSGIPVLLNTSLNVKNEPLVNSEDDALRWARENKNIKLLLRS